MEEPVTKCVGACGQPILDREAPDIRPVERLVEMPQGFGGKRELEWRPAGLAHAGCELPAGFKFVGD